MITCFQWVYGASGAVENPTLLWQCVNSMLKNVTNALIKKLTNFKMQIKKNKTLFLLLLLKDTPSFNEIGVGAHSCRNVSMGWPNRVTLNIFNTKKYLYIKKYLIYKNTIFYLYTGQQLFKNNSIGIYLIQFNPLKEKRKSFQKVDEKEWKLYLKKPLLKVKEVSRRQKPCLV